jgi:hypothetical protein
MRVQKRPGEGRRVLGGAGGRKYARWEVRRKYAQVEVVFTSDILTTFTFMHTCDKLTIFTYIHACDIITIH